MSLTAVSLCPASGWRALRRSCARCRVGTQVNACARKT